MARIRTVKPDFFRHELLQDLESDHPELHPMLVFIGLWTQCDKNGVFEYKPRQLKLDILPFLQFDMGESLMLLSEAKLISLMLHGEKIYGLVATFRDHQRINGKESQEASKYPQPCEMIEYEVEGSKREAPEKQPRRQEGKGREKEGKRKRNGKSGTGSVHDDLLPICKAWQAFKAMRRSMNKPMTDYAEILMVKKVADLQAKGHDPTDVLNLAIEKSWQSVYEPKELQHGTGGTNRSTAATGGKTGAVGNQCLNAASDIKPDGYFAGDFPDRSDQW